MVEYFDMVNSPEDKLIRARTQLVENAPFWGVLALRLRFTKVESKEEVSLYGTIRTMAVDYEGHCFYNPKWVMKLTDSQIIFSLAHEISHVAFIHNTRFPFWDDLEQMKKDFKDITEGNIKKLIEQKSKWLMWNIAGDIAINNILVKSGFDMPEGLYSSKLPGYDKYESMFTEEIFEDLMKDPKKINIKIVVCGGIMPGAAGQKKKDGTEVDAKDISAKEKEWQKAVIESATNALRQGKLPEHLQKLVDIYVENPSMPWWSILQRYVTKLFPVDWTWKRPSRRARALRIYLPTTVKEHFKAVITMDVSGSIGDPQYVDFCSQMYYISRSFRNIDFTVIMNDAEVKGTVLEHSKWFDEVREYIGTRKGYGGTVFTPAFKWINDNMPDCKLHIFFTDLCGEFPEPKDQGDYDTIWVCSNNSMKDAPFGTTIRMYPGQKRPEDDY